MSECLKKQTLMAFADRELPIGDMVSAERHVSVCASCQRELEGIRATSMKVDSLLSSLAPPEMANANAIAVVSIPYSGANVRMRWTAVASVGVLVATLFLFVIVRREQPAPALNVVKSTASAPASTVEKKEALVAVVAKPAHVGAPNSRMKVRQFQALDDGESIETGMIYRVSLPAPSSVDAPATQSVKRIPAEVIVDEFGKVRAIRFLR